ncbi:O-methyltransferase [Novosphingobium sediminicola]|uniref:Putative O-methyltransferase YrrM n=1 Tax=Novosphingobium sediminicola TaxID=563162 RepID=A0A7W6CKN1_9SPHN|nr:class I SAM-dependent methyltransferase [Novosphingobium sediminicola]MBB3957225.1 putative O-methyltransferase YrrM [Novosphingobium sediminicola]
MSLLTQAPLNTLLDRLFVEADATRPENLPIFAATAPAERERLMRSKADWRRLYGALKDMPLPVSREAGRLLYMLVRATGAQAIVEFGASFGLSTLHMAAALRDNGGGCLITSEFETGKIARAQAHLAEAGLADLVEIRAGDALETLARDLPPAIDLVLLDGAKALYRDVLGLLEPHLRPGALILADNADYCPDYLAKVRAHGGGYLSLPFAKDVELSMCLG